MIQNLIQIEMASKILLGAQAKSDFMNPFEYCMKAAGVHMAQLDNQDPEFKAINDYALNTLVDLDNKKQIQRILKLTKPSEDFT